MKVVILCGGFGTRISEYTETIPKPMLTVGDKPLLWHVMQTFINYGINDFYLALGYKASFVKEYFLNYHALNSDFTIDFSTGELSLRKPFSSDFKVTLIDTGLESLTGSRLKKMKSYLDDSKFFLTYGDSVGNVNINDLVNSHNSASKIITMTAVRPAARFGELDLDSNGAVKAFKEKPQLEQGWINGGYFVVEPDFFDYIGDDDTMLERSPLEAAVQQSQLNAYKHSGFWHCVDTKRDLVLMQKLWDESSDSPPWF